MSLYCWQWLYTDITPRTRCCFSNAITCNNIALYIHCLTCFLMSGTSKRWRIYWSRRMFIFTVSRRMFIFTLSRWRFIFNLSRRMFIFTLSHRMFIFTLPRRMFIFTSSRRMFIFTFWSNGELHVLTQQIMIPYVIPLMVHISLSEAKILSAYRTSRELHVTRKPNLSRPYSGPHEFTVPQIPCI